jgi:hypothetical protein
MFALYFVGAGFFTVFGWNAGQIVWDKWIDPPAIEQKAENEHTKK